MLIPYRDNLCSRYAEKMVSIKVGSACNARCSFCVDAGGYDPIGFNPLATADEANALREYHTAIVTGGEPLLYIDKVLVLLKQLRPHKSRIVLNTNGFLLTPEIVSSLNGLIDELQISIHHPDEDKNAVVFGTIRPSFEAMRLALENKWFSASINQCFSNIYRPEEHAGAVDKMIDLCCRMGADRLRLTELKKVSEDQFVPAEDFYPAGHPAVQRDSRRLIEDGCTYYYQQSDVTISVKRLCCHAKGKNAQAFSCCFIDGDGQKKIDVDTAETFRVIYGDGNVTSDWIFQPEQANLSS
ncbi:MAG: radical SAM protein [Candidatus Nomurabacteria bacterium]|jgi:MoaA/NifB/PqqE/SkfB family radical SAM enzyme|nr:radical SAM protein [Candidatus Nomurabacteria bacterium]